MTIQEQLLKEILPDDVFTSLNEETNVNEVIANLRQTNKALFLNGLTAEDVPETIKDKLTTDAVFNAKQDTTGKVFGSAITKVKRLGVSEEDAKEFSGSEEPKLEDYIKAVEAVMTKGKSEAENTFKVKYEAEKQKYFDLQKEKDEEASKWETKWNEREEADNLKLKQGKIEAGLDKFIIGLRGEKPEEDSFQRNYTNKTIKVLTREFLKENNYKEEIAEDGTYTILNADGTKIDDGKGFVSPDKIILKGADKIGFARVANGGGGAEAEPDPNTVTEESDAMKQLDKDLGLV